MAITIVSAEIIHRIGLQGIFEQFSKGAGGWAKDIAPAILPTRQEYDYFVQEGDFGLATVVNAASPIPTDEPAYVFPFTVFPVKYGIGWDVATEALETDIYGRIKTYVQKANSAMRQSREQAVANLINNATSTQAAFKNPDGQPLASSAHVLASGATTSNVMSSAFGPLALESMIENLSLQVSHRGLPDPDMGPFVLMCHPSLSMYVQRVIGSDRFPTTPNNDPNPAGHLISKVVASPWFTSPLFWALRNEKEDEQPFCVSTRRAPTLAQHGEIGRDVVQYRLTEIYAPFSRGWRGFYYSSGLGN